MPVQYPGNPHADSTSPHLILPIFVRVAADQVRKAMILYDLLELQTTLVLNYMDL